MNAETLANQFADIEVTKLLIHATRHLLDHGPRFSAPGDAEAIDIILRAMDGELPDVPFAELEFPSSVKPFQPFPPY